MKTKKSFKSVVFHHAYRSMPVPQKILSTAAGMIYAGEKIPPKKMVHVIFCSDYFIKKLNGKFRNKPHPTDVLSFNYDEDDFIGEIYLSLQRAKIQAKHYSVSYEEEILRLFVHGMIHLAGYDHENESERIRMEAIEKKYLK